MTTKLVTCALATAVLLSPQAATAASLTDITVFSSNSEGNNWNSLIWNTRGEDTDMPPPGRWNLYVSQDPLGDATPTFINGFNDNRARVTLPLVAGDLTYSIYGEGVGRTFDAQQHFVLNLYFDGVQTVPGISAVQNLSSSNLAAAGHANGLDIFGNSGHPEAASLSAMLGSQVITLTAFSWITDGQRDVVWPYWANDSPYNQGSGSLDYYGSFTLNVRAVPEPASYGLLGLGLLALSMLQRRTRAR